MDAAWNIFHAGYIGKGSEPGLNVWSEQQYSIDDEYRFIQKNFNSIWCIYILIIRIISFHNPYKEFMGWWKTKNVKRVKYATQPYGYPIYNEFASRLIEEQPLVSVIIPTLNRYEYLKDGLKDLEKQTYKNFEVIVVDQSEPFDESFYAPWNFRIRYWNQTEKALWKARNDAISTAQGKYILLYDDDSRVEPNWIEQHLKTLEFFDADISSGVSISTVGAKVPEHYSYFRWSDQLDTGNVLIKRQVFEKIGLFDRQFEKQRMGDGEFGLRAYLVGFRNISNPYAKRLHLKVGEGGLRQMGSWDGWRPKSILSPRPIPSVLYLYRKYFGKRIAFYMILLNLPSSVVPYRWKDRMVFLPFVIPVCIIMLPILLIQVCSSWMKSTQMLKNPKIKLIKSA
jgi:GT2 family glycosyltransferase